VNPEGIVFLDRPLDLGFDFRGTQAAVEGIQIESARSGCALDRIKGEFLTAEEQVLVLAEPALLIGAESRFGARKCERMNGERGLAVDDADSLGMPALESLQNW
jgi:hypothetical protein